MPLNKKILAVQKAEALKLIGHLVTAWTAANGQYVGELVEVLNMRPWRAKVRVTGVLSSATHYERGAVCRRGFREGELLEVGNSSVKPADGVTGTDYLTALRKAQADSQMWFDKNPTGQYAWAHKGTADALLLAIAAEEHRLLTGEWLLKPPVKQPPTPFA